MGADRHDPAGTKLATDNRRCVDHRAFLGRMENFFGTKPRKDLVRAQAGGVPWRDDRSVLIANHQIFIDSGKSLFAFRGQLNFLIAGFSPVPMLRGPTPSTSRLPVKTAVSIRLSDQP